MENRKYTHKALLFAKQLRISQTNVEEILWYNLRNNRLNGIKFRRQVPIGKYIADFVCLNKKLIIELDGSQHIDNINYDTARSEFLSQNGYTIIRIFNDEVSKDVKSVLEYIYQKYLEL